MKYYVGLTIGPITDTIGNATVPAALWFSSYLFADLSRRLCAGILAALPEARLLSTAYRPDIHLEQDGVGLYADRILFRVEGEETEIRDALNVVVTVCRDETAGAFPEHYDRKEMRGFFRDYLQIHFVLLPEPKLAGRDKLKALNDCLDALELMKTFPASSLHDPFSRLFANDDARDRESGARNSEIKASPLFPQRKAAYLLNPFGAVRDIPDIARTNADMEKKYSRYFAVVNADGDGIGNFQASFGEEEVERFSEACLQYRLQVTELIHAFGGMPVYAGGDDLLFLAPIYGTVDGQRGTVLTLCQAIRELFHRCVRDLFPAASEYPTVSFGVSVQYEKHPLYEALDKGEDLMNWAKYDVFHDSKGDPIKDNLALELRKHSGQSLKLAVHNPDFPAFRKLMDAMLLGDDSKKTAAVLRQVLHAAPLLELHLRKTEAALQAPGADPDAAKKRFGKIWMNFFDNPGQAVFENYLNGLGGAVFDVFLRERHLLWGEETDTKGPLGVMTGLLRWARFLEEKAGERE